MIPPSIRARSRRLRLPLAVCGFLAAAAQCPAIGQAATPPAGRIVLTCTNPYSHTSWLVRIELRQRTVDGYPADITAVRITWHDLHDGGHYSLDRLTGSLTVIVASSTGGYVLHDDCRPASDTD